METIFNILLIIHIITGISGLVTGTINISRKKGDELHKNIGVFYFFSMLINGFTALLMSVLHLNLFLFIVGVFSIYLVFTGQRYLLFKKMNKGEKAEVLDWALSIFMLLFGIVFVFYGLYLFTEGPDLGLVLVVFGFISIRMAANDYNNYKGRNNTKNFWLIVHIQRMIGSFIAAITALIVVNNTFLPEIVAWLLPTVVLIPLILMWTKKYKINQRN